jgi:DNA polymerase-3 subunit gamma/tau
MNLANKYRPQSFIDVVGQEHVKKILANQLRTKDIKNAYLFTGGAGTGKTTNARIFANCIDAEVIEIDGASNNGVDNVRELIESSRYRPISAAYKAYIIDEVHMLSTGAFNALLKTLEEPPAHAVFILATTDPQKIPATIMSRVQRFDFHRLTVEQIVANLSNIAEAEDRSVAEDALEYIAKLAQGGMRDAITILDTSLGYVSEGETLTLDTVIDVVGTTPHSLYIDLCRYKEAGNTLEILNLLEQVYASGADFKRFVAGLLEFVVDVEKLVVLDDMRYVAAPAIYEVDMRSLADMNLLKWYKPLSDLLAQIKYEHSPKTLVTGAILCL